MQSREILLWAIGLATPFFLFFGWLSDKVGRKWIMLIGMLLGVFFYRPIFKTFLEDTNAKEWVKDTKNLTNTVEERKSSIEKIQKHDSTYLVNKIENIFHYKENSFLEKKIDTTIYIGSWKIYPGQSVIPDNEKSKIVEIKDVRPPYTNIVLSNTTKWKFIFLVWAMIIFVTMAYGPIAAFLVELFPTKIRYTSMSLPYHIGNGVFGGLVPFIATLLSTTFANDPLVGLWYPIGVAALCFVIGAIYLSNKRNIDVMD